MDVQILVIHQRNQEQSEIILGITIGILVIGYDGFDRSRL